MTTPTAQQELEKAKELLRRCYNTILSRHGEGGVTEAIDAFFDSNNLSEAVTGVAQSNSATHAESAALPVPSGGANPPVAELPEVEMQCPERIDMEDGTYLERVNDKPASTSLKEEQKEVMPNDATASRQPNAVTPPPSSDPTVMRVCSECKGERGFMTQISMPSVPSGQTPCWNRCPTCKGSGQVPAVDTPDEEKSLGQIAYEEWNAIVHPNGGIPWERVGMQVGWQNIAQDVATAACAVKDKEIEELRRKWSEAEKQVTSLIHYHEINERQEAADEITRLRLLLADAGKALEALLLISRQSKLQEGDGSIIVACIKTSEAIAKDLNP